jgi:CPA1 family monovalent cation:H+ antiporter
MAAMSFEAVFVLLFTIASTVALVVRWLRVPYTAALVIAGLVLGTTHAFTPPHLTKELLYALFLPGLIFEAAFHLDYQKFWQNKIAIHALAVPGLVAAMALTAALLTPVADALHFVTGFTFSHGLVFAALIAATDPIAVVAVFKTLGVPRRLAILVEGESLLNDGTAVVVFTLILGLVGGRALSLPAAALGFIKIVGMGLFIGLAVGFAVSKVIQQVDDPMIEITLTTIAAYGAFVAAEQLHYSGVIATVAAGMLCGNYGARTGMSPSTRIAVESFWEYVAFALNSIVFLLIGFEVHVDALLASWKAILVAYLAATIGRAALIAVVTLLLGRTRERIPWSWSAVLTWGGLRGGLSMVLALALPKDFPHRDLIITMTFGVVVLSILIQGLTMPRLLRLLGITGVAVGREEYEIKRGALRSAQAALRSLEQMAREKFAHGDVLSAVQKEYEAHLREAETGIRDLHLEQSRLRDEELHAVRRHLLLSEKDELLRTYHQGMIGQEALDRLLEDIDARLLKLESGEESGHSS